MKTFISILLISTATIAYSQNEDNSNTVQQQVIQYSNVNGFNNRGNFNVNPSTQNNRGNVNKPSTVRTKQVRSRGSRVNTINNYSQNIQVNNALNDNVGNSQNKNNPVQFVEQTQTIVEVPQINVNLNLSLNVPTINLNIKTKEEKVKEKVAPKRLEDFRIKTGNSSSSGSISHKSKKEKKSFQKKVLKPIKCWMQRTFRHNAKFHINCECFKF